MSEIIGVRGFTPWCVYRHQCFGPAEMRESYRNRVVILLFCTLFRIHSVSDSKQMQAQRIPLSKCTWSLSQAPSIWACAYTLGQQASVGW